MSELRGDDPRQWGHSLANLAEILIPLLGATQAKSVAEIGALAGDLTRELLSWAEGAGAQVIAVDPAPEPELVQLSKSRDDLMLIREPSHGALPSLPPVDAIVIDGDHNYYTVSEELRLIDERFPPAKAPLILLHDISWPHARRDTYYVPDRIPEADRQPMVEGACLLPDQPGIAKSGLLFKWAAEREGGPRNGVLTALEDFVEGRDDLRLARVPAFFGLGVVWHRDAEWSSSVAEIVGPWDANPIVDRLEANRVHHLAYEISRRAELNEIRAHNGRMEDFLRKLIDSRTFRLAERLSRLRNRGRRASWRETAEGLIERD